MPTLTKPDTKLVYVHLPREVHAIWELYVKHCSKKYDTVGEEVSQWMTDFAYDICIELLDDKGIKIDWEGPPDG